MTAKEFFEKQLITDANSVIDKTAHKFSRTDLIKFATAYYKSEVKNLDIPCVIKSVCPKCNGKDVRPYKDHLCCYECGNYWQTVL